MAAGPAVKVRRILEARRRDWEPSMPMQEALLKVEAPPRPRAPTKSLAISSLKRRRKKNEESTQTQYCAKLKVATAQNCSFTLPHYIKILQNMNNNLWKSLSQMGFVKKNEILYSEI